MTASYHFDLHDLYIEAELLGVKLERTLEGRQCWLEFPADEASFGLGKDDRLSAISGWSGTVESPRQRLSVRTIRVTVEIDSDITADEVQASGSHDDYARLSECSDLLASAADIARRVVIDLVNFVRISDGQYWLAPMHRPPDVTGLTDVRDHRGDRVPTGYAQPMHVYARRNVGLTRAHLDLLSQKIDSGGRPALAEELLADARFYSSSESQPNPRIAVLFAAIAAEVRIKTFLADHASPSQAALVTLLLANPRDVSLAAVSLYDKGILAVMGRSMRDAEPTSYKALARLFEARNRLAHRGDAANITYAESSEAVAASGEAFRYLSSLD